MISFLPLFLLALILWVGVWKAISWLYDWMTGP